MIKKIKKHQKLLLVILLVMCLGTILIGGICYVNILQKNLQNQAIQNVMDVTMQQRQAFDNFISADQERLHSYAEYFSESDHSNPEEIQHALMLFKQVDAIWSVYCLDEGWFCSNLSDEIRQIDEEHLEEYRGFTGSGVRDNYIGLISGNPKFGYYETFTFSNGHKGMIQKSYDRSKVLKTFSLSLYDGKGYGYILDQDGDILMRSTIVSGSRVYDNVFDALTDIHSQPEDIEAFAAALKAQEAGSIIFTGDYDEYVYTYVPIESIDNWHLLTIVPVDAITAETNEILQNSRMTLGLLVLLLMICTLLIQFIRRTHKDIEEKEHEVEYQAQLFDIFSTYLSSNTDDVYMMLDVESKRVEYISPNMERVFGLSEQQITEKLMNFERIDASGEKVNMEILSKLQPGIRIDEITAEWVNPRTGDHKWFLENVYCTRLQDSNKLVFYVSDRTKERNIQNSLAEALRMAQAANDAKSAFLSSVSHDIRTPMNAIIGFLALMRDEVNDPGMVMEYNKRIDAASQHLLGLINDVLDMNKIESGGVTLSISEMNLADVIDEINTIIRPQAKAKNQTFDILVSNMAHEHLMGDKLRINQVLINLLSNAVKYTPENGRIMMRVEELSQVVENYSRIRFTISDNGMGMSEDYLKVIFEPFTREETKSTHEIQGTGLGMAITKGLVDLLGGSIHVESRLNQGSTFIVELELCIQEMEEDLKFWTDYSVARMIVTDDDEEVCHNIVKIMSRTGVVTDYSTDGGTAVQMMRSAREEGHPYDLILLDWKMPNLDGLETARLIRKNYSRKIPILLLTAYDWSEIAQEAIEIGVNHFMPKPFFMSNFKTAIRRVMGSQKKPEDSQQNVVNGMHIMVVDDIEVNQIILVKILGSLGALCDTAGNGQEAVEMFEASQPDDYDLILMDVQMPVMDGYTATRTIRSSSHPSAKTVPIIAMTANAFVEDVRDAIKSGMDAHIAKPVQIDNLKMTIQQVLDSRLEQKK